MSIVKFMSPGCQPCKAVGRVLDQMEVEYTEVNISEDMTAAIEHRVLNVPTLINTDTGAKLIGFPGILKTQEWINEHSN